MPRPSLSPSLSPSSSFQSALLSSALSGPTSSLAFRSLSRRITGPCLSRPHRKTHRTLSSTDFEHTEIPSSPVSYISRTFRSWNGFKFKERFNCFDFSDYIVWIFKSNRLIRITKLRRIAKKRGIFSRWTNFNNYGLKHEIYVIIN